MKKTSKELVNKFRMNHNRALETLRASDCEKSGVQMWRKLCALERVAIAITTAACNGENVRVYWPDFKIPTDLDFSTDYIQAHDCAASRVADNIRLIFGHIPKGFFLNFDARGYALKINPDEVTIPDGMHKDWGSNGILAAQIDG